jgi:hypothetical protein
MNRAFGQDYIRDEFQRLEDQVEDQLTLYLIGGGAMAFHGIKDATKDIDVVVQGDDDVRRLRTALESLGYDVVKDLDEEYEQLGAQLILENEDGCRFDVFNRQVVDKLIFSASMQERSQPLGETGDLVVSVAAPEDIFLFKAVAGRTGDIADMNTLVQTGLDFDAIVAEIETQTELLGEEFFVTFIGEALGKLEERFNVTTPITGHVETITTRVYEQLEILMQIEDKTSIDAVKQTVDLPEDRLYELLDDLEEKGVIERDDGTVQKMAERP